MKKSIKIVIIFAVIGGLFLGVWAGLDSNTKNSLYRNTLCKLIYGKNICNFYEMMDTVSTNPEKSDFEKAMQLCQDMEDVPKKDGCFEYVAEVISFWDSEKAKQACDEIVGYGLIYSQNKCYSKIIDYNNPCAVCINGCDTCPEGCEECLIGIEKKLKDPNMKWYYNPDMR